MGNQMIFKRYEIKYMLTDKQKIELLNVMQDRMAADIHGRNTILSLYLDTPDYFLIRRSIEKPVYKEKLRLRSYGVASKDSEVFIELKKKYDSVVYKRRVGMSEAELEHYLSTGVSGRDSQIMREIDYSIGRYAGIAPRMLISYEREAFYDRSDYDFRMTFDENILWCDDDLSLCSPVRGQRLLPPSQVLLEVKTSGAIPLWLVHFLSENKIRPASFSKYGSAYTTMLSSRNDTNTRPDITDIQNGGIYQYA